MNSLIQLWNAITGLTASLTRTKELVDAANARMEQSLGLDHPTLSITGVETSPKRVKGSKE